MEKQGIESILKVIEHLGNATVMGCDIMADGKVSWVEMFKIPKVFAEIQQAVANAPAVVPEVKDLDAAESVLVLEALFAILAKVKPAV